MKYLVGNWKMNQSLEEIASFFDDVQTNDNPNIQSWIAPQLLHVGNCRILALDKNIEVGTQNISTNDSGAFTGETSPLAAREMGVHFTLIGHSERRSLFNENNELLNKKVKNSLKNKLKVIFCIGETLQQRESGETLAILKNQTLKGLSDITGFKDIIIAYEPVWAIGTGKVATSKEIKEVHAYLRDLTKEHFKAEIPLLYGGSVKPDNVQEIMATPNVDGALVGGASLKAADYNKLYNAMK